MIFLCIAIATGASIGSVIFVQRNSQMLGLMQHVNERSSHIVATPTGGGVGIFLGSLLGTLTWLSFDTRGSDELTNSIAAVMFLASVIGLMGLWDDRRPLPAKLRLFVQFLAVGILVVFVSEFGIFGTSRNLPITLILIILLTVSGVWWVNLFNFMDGIDGYAGTECMFLIVSALVLGWLQAGTIWQSPLFVMMLCFAASLFGFMLFNWPPARIFMGDVGSTFLGFLLFAVALLTIELGWLSVLQWLVLGSIFIMDASFTLFLRLLRGESITKAHKNHAYQILSRRWGHKAVSLTLLAINIVVIFPLVLKM